MENGKLSVIVVCKCFFILLTSIFLFYFFKICLFLACTYQNCFVFVLTCNKLSVYDGEAV